MDSSTAQKSDLDAVRAICARYQIEVKKLTSIIGSFDYPPRPDIDFRLFLGALFAASPSCAQAPGLAERRPAVGEALLKLGHFLLFEGTIGKEVHYSDHDVTVINFKSFPVQLSSIWSKQCS